MKLAVAPTYRLIVSSDCPIFQRNSERFKSNFIAPQRTRARFSFILAIWVHVRLHVYCKLLMVKELPGVFTIGSTNNRQINKQLDWVSGLPSISPARWVKKETNFNVNIRHTCSNTNYNNNTPYAGLWAEPPLSKKENTTYTQIKLWNLRKTNSYV